MATIRLDDINRNNIINGFDNILERATNNKPFPLAKEDIWKFGLSLLPDKTAECYMYLREHNKQLTTATGWHPSFILKDNEHTYEVTLYDGSLPRNGMEVGGLHPEFSSLHGWASQYCNLQSHVRKSSQIVRRIIRACSSSGQIKRVMQPEILRFLPDHILESFNEAERQSRIPRGLELHEGDLETLMNTLAIASLSPREIGGVGASAEREKI